MSREILKTTGVYKNGSITLKEDLPLKEGRVFISVSPVSPKGNAGKVLKTLAKFAGTMPNFSDGVTYVRNLRRESEKRFKRLKW